MEDPKERFGFGKNWNEFIAKQFSPERIATAQAKLLDTLKLADLKGKTFLDIGCGSGLHSLAAIQAGAEKVVSFDYDPHSVHTAQMLKGMFGNPTNWEIQQGSVLNDAFMHTLGRFDIVYSWGVLHHTGHMWQAIENARIPVSDNGVLFIALYSHTAYESAQVWGKPGPDTWLAIKQKYNRASPFMKRCMEWQYVWHDSIKPPATKPWLAVRRYADFKKREKAYIADRGMEIWTDIRDWLGGWPMEYVNELELQAFARQRLGMALLEMETVVSNTEFIFTPIGADNWFTKRYEAQQEQALAAPFTHQGGKCWLASVPELSALADHNDSPFVSPIRLYENNTMMTYAHTAHLAIHQFGAGRYSHWGEWLYFSASDNSDPNTNGRAYSIRYNP